MITINDECRTMMKNVFRLSSCRYNFDDPCGETSRVIVQCEMGSSKLAEGFLDDPLPFLACHILVITKTTQVRHANLLLT